jgi:hypothetical protein
MIVDMDMERDPAAAASEETGEGREDVAVGKAATAAAAGCEKEVAALEAASGVLGDADEGAVAAAAALQVMAEWDGLYSSSWKSCMHGAQCNNKGSCQVS